MLNIIRQSESHARPTYHWLDRQAYSHFLDKMQQYIACFDGKETIWFCEHHHVYTTGKRGIDNRNKKLNAPLIQTERGGETTYHGLGQLMMYPMIHLKSHGLSVRSYVHLLEESVILLLKAYGLHVERDCGLPGVWLNQQKIAALGIRVTHGITSHGIALNVFTDLTWFDAINPCGTSRKTTSMQQQHIHNIGLENLSQQWFLIITDLLKVKKL